MRQLRARTGDSEEARIQRLARGLLLAAEQRQVMPGPDQWVEAVASTLGLATTDVDLVFPAHAGDTTHRRRMVVDPRLGSGVLPFTQTVAGVSAAAASLLSSNARVMLVSSSRRGLSVPWVDSAPSSVEFQALWEQINRKAAYTVAFDSVELVKNAVDTIDRELRVEKLSFVIKRGQQNSLVTSDDLALKKSFSVTVSQTEQVEGSVRASVTYDLIGSIAEATQLTRRTVAEILAKLQKPVFAQFRANPEAFIAGAIRLINEQKATMIVKHLAYDPIDERYDSVIFTVEKNKEDFAKAFRAKNHIYDYVFTDSKGERDFVEELDSSIEVKVYAKLPRGFAIPTPVGDYNPDWAIAFDAGKVRHVYFIAETKGSMSSLELREIEKSKIECAKKFFAKITDEQVKYEVVDSYSKLMTLVK